LLDGHGVLLCLSATGRCRARKIGVRGVRERGRRWVDGVETGRRKRVTGPRGEGGETRIIGPKETRAAKRGYSQLLWVNTKRVRQDSQRVVASLHLQKREQVAPPLR